MIDLLDILLKYIAAFGLLIGGLWAWTKYVTERGLVPPTELNLECNFIGEKENERIVEVTVHIINKGSSTLRVKNVLLKLKTICAKDKLILYNDKRKLGRLKFPNSLSENLIKEKKNEIKNEFCLMPYDTFVQPGVDQKYSFVTTVNGNTEFLHAHGEFQYAQKPTIIQKMILWISRRLGLIQYSLQNINEPHTIQKVFNIKNMS